MQCKVLKYNTYFAYLKWLSRHSQGSLDSNDLSKGKTFTESTPNHFQAYNVVLPPLYKWDLLGSRASTYKLPLSKPLHTIFQEWQMHGCIWESRLQLVGILELLGVEAVEDAIKVFTGFGSCFVVPLHLACKMLHLCQDFYTHRNWVLWPWVANLTLMEANGGRYTCFLVRQQQDVPLAVLLLTSGLTYKNRSSLQHSIRIT